jgi:hypothetical protein
MFFAALIALPVLAGIVAGVSTDRRAVPWTLAAACVALGCVGAVILGLDPDTEGRAGSVAFGVGAGLVSAGLVWIGYGLGRMTRRSPSHA